MQDTEIERIHNIIHDTIELRDELINMGHSPKTALGLASSAMTNWRLEVMAIEIDGIKDAVGAMMAINAIEKIRAVKLEGVSSMEELRDMLKAREEPKQ